MKISINFLRYRTSTFEDNSCVVLVADKAIVGLFAKRQLYSHPGRDIPSYPTWPESDPKPYALLFDDVTCIYHHEIRHVYKVNCYLLPITKIALPNTTIFTQLNLFLKFAPCQGHAMHRGWIILPCIG